VYAVVLSFAFSSENCAAPQDEVSALMDCLSYFALERRSAQNCFAKIFAWFYWWNARISAACYRILMAKGGNITLTIQHDF